MSLVRKFILTVSAVGFTASSGFANQLLKAESSNATVRSVSTITVAACSITACIFIIIDPSRATAFAAVGILDQTPRDNALDLSRAMLGDHFQNYQQFISTNGPLQIGSLTSVEDLVHLGMASSTASALLQAINSYKKDLAK